MSEIYTTKDYNLFKKHENNRDIDQNNLKKIILSLQTQNLLEFRPILVDRDMRIIDGQHRFEAAKTLNLEIHYQISNNDHSEDILLLNANQKNWVVEDYVKYYVSKGNENYKKYLEYATKKNIGLSHLYKYFFRNNGRDSQKMKDGTFIFPTEDKIKEISEMLDKVNNLINLLQKYLITNKTIGKSVMLRYAILSLIRNPLLDYDVFITKITYKAESLRPCTTKQAYYCMLRDIYNYRNPNPID